MTVSHWWQNLCELLPSGVMSSKQQSLGASKTSKDSDSIDDELTPRLGNWLTIYYYLTYITYFTWSLVFLLALKYHNITCRTFTCTRDTPIEIMSQARSRKKWSSDSIKSEPFWDWDTKIGVHPSIPCQHNSRQVSKES